jgi:EAL domain-containing protein (putative c-di-GMP-specific phosphodiesterase class I)
VHYPELEEGRKLRRRPESFADHYSQATLFWNSMSQWEKKHIVEAYRFGTRTQAAAQRDAVQQRAQCSIETTRAAVLDPATLVLEITEGAMLHETDAVVGRLASLKALGVKLALDDFGTGYSSFSYLQRLPIDVLKIDRTFIGMIETDDRKSTLAQAIVSMAQIMELVAVAEGVETSTQAEMLGRMGCDMAQGYHLARPLAAEELPAYVRAREGTLALRRR